MIHVFGDSHGLFSFDGLANSINHSRPAITMHRIGRNDSAFMNLNSNERITSAPYSIHQYGEIDCRCHIGRQDRPASAVISTLVSSYIQSILHHLPSDSKLAIVCAVPPPTYQSKYESVHGPITHEYPFIGSDEDRVKYSTDLNRSLAEACGVDERLRFLDVYSSFRDDRGMMIFEMSDQCVHVGSSAPCIKVVKDVLG